MKEKRMINRWRNAELKEKKENDLQKKERDIC